MKTIVNINSLRRDFWCWAALGAALTCGCGPYSFSGSTATHLKTIAVPVFEDRTAEFGIKERLSSTLINEFTRDNTLKIADRRTADSILLGTLLRVEERAGVYDQNQNVQKIRVSLTVDMKYEDLKKKKIVWEAQITQFGDYTPPDRQAAIDEAISKIANEALNKTVSGW
ncbi:MAG: LPS assembly lipoprotein LptE [bacterium]